MNIQHKYFVEPFLYAIITISISKNQQIDANIFIRKSVNNLIMNLKLFKFYFIFHMRNRIVVTIQF